MSQRKSALDILFGSELRTRLLRFFLLNTDTVFPIDVLRKRTGANGLTLKNEIHTLVKSGFLKSAVGQTLNSEEEHISPGGKRLIPKKIKGYVTDQTFPFFNELRALFLSAVPDARATIGKDIRRIGKVKTVILSGIFLNSRSAPLDILLVGENIKTRQLEMILKKMERDLGKDLVYAVMPTQEFEYRFGMKDRFLDSLLEAPHETIMDQLDIVEKRGY